MDNKIDIDDIFYNLRNHYDFDPKEILLKVCQNLNVECFITKSNKQHILKLGTDDFLIVGKGNNHTKFNNAHVGTIKINKRHDNFLEEDIIDYFLNQKYYGVTSSTLVLNARINNTFNIKIESTRSSIKISKHTLENYINALILEGMNLLDSNNKLAIPIVKYNTNRLKNHLSDLQFLRKKYIILLKIYISK